MKCSLGVPKIRDNPVCSVAKCGVIKNNEVGFGGNLEACPELVEGKLQNHDKTNIHKFNQKTTTHEKKRK